MEHRRFFRYAVAVLAYNVGVVLFGAVVRATESGAGCGTNWPSCQGSVFPEGGSTETIIEFTHRATSGIALVLVAVLVVWARRILPVGDAGRIAAVVSGALILNEALIGAALVLFEWVADDESVGRLISIVVHLVNTFLLLGALALTAWCSSGRPVPKRPFAPDRYRPIRLGAVLLLLVGAAGAVTALGDTLFPPESVGAGLFDDLRGTLIVRLRWIHPVLAVATAGYLWLLSGRIDPDGAPAVAVRGLVAVQVVAGVANVALLAPLWMQVVHLLLADLVWIAFVVFAIRALTVRESVPV